VHKLLIFLKRRPGLSREEFRSYYESNHAPLCLKYMAGVERYVRRYLEPAPGMPEMEADVITEVWFRHRTALDHVLATAAQDQLPPDVLADEQHLFDRSKSRFCAVTECETEFAPAARS
jgi:hypothetical protein